MSTVPSRWPEIRAVFDAIADLPPPEREVQIAAAALDAASLAELRSLLGHHDAVDASTAFMAASAAQALADTAARPGQRFGDWEVVRPLGEGGMGEVFEARRADGSFEGRAAIKLLKLGMDSTAVLRRFALERQALARLNHPHIARLFDAGQTDTGLPYFVMEFVQGLPIDEATAGLPIAERLRLFLQLADAVSHAHHHLLVHRDLKPGNVLVTPQGQVKLLDFGIAKALDPTEPGADAAAGGGGDTTLGTVRPHTPNYASPEQIRGEPVSTATDVYSLGVLLYLVLTGQRPTGRGATTPAEAARGVLEESPARPSAVAANMASGSARRPFPGDLDNIVLKALEKPIDRRYRSVEAFAQDLRRFASGHPVSARAASRGYLFARFVGRNRAVVVAAAVAIVAVFGGLAASLWHGRQTELARDDAQRQLGLVKQITTDIVFRFGDTADGLAGGVAAQEALFVGTLAALAPALAAAPDDADLNAMSASLLGRLAELRGNTARASPERAREAEATVAQALLLAERAWGQRRGDWRFASWHVRTLVVKAMLLGGQDRPAEGLQALALAVARSSESLALPQPLPGRAHLLAARGGALLVSGQMQARLSAAQAASGAAAAPAAQAIAAFDLAEADHRALLGDAALLAEVDRNAAPGDTPAAATFRHQIGSILGARATLRLQRGEPEAARRDAEHALAIRQENLRLDPRNAFWRDGLINENHTLSIALFRLGDLPGALEANRVCRDTTEALAAEAGPQSKWARQRHDFSAQHAQVLARLGRHTEAVPAFDEAITHHRQQLAAARNDAGRRRLDELIATAQMQRADSLAALGRVATGEPTGNGPPSAR